MRSAPLTLTIAATGAALVVLALALGIGGAASAAESRLPTVGTIVFGDDAGAFSTIAPDGGERRVLGELGGSSPRWSPNGSRIAYVSDFRRIRIADADGT